LLCGSGWGRADLRLSAWRRKSSACREGTGFVAARCGVGRTRRAARKGAQSTSRFKPSATVCARGAANISGTHSAAVNADIPRNATPFQFNGSTYYIVPLAKEAAQK